MTIAPPILSFLPYALHIGKAAVFKSSALSLAEAMPEIISIDNRLETPAVRSGRGRRR
jgi:hypothetical protein